MAKIILNEDKFYFDAEDGGAQQELTIWNETSKANEAHPDGKPWIKLPKGNITNRQYYSLDLFNKTAVDGEVVVEVKVAGPRVLGSTGVKKSITAWLDDATTVEYETLVNDALEAYKTAKNATKKKKLNEMTLEELEAHLAFLKTGEAVPTATAPKSFMDMFTEEQYNRYNEILAMAQENKANAPKKVRGPLTDEEKIARAQKKKLAQISKAEALLATMKAAYNQNAAPAGEDDIDDVDDYNELD